MTLSSITWRHFRLVLLLGPALAAAQSMPVAPDPAHRIELVRATAPIVIDGKLDDAAWKGAASITDLRQIRPRDGEPASERTTVYVTYDDDALYVGTHAQDAGGRSAVIAKTLKHGSSLLNDDRIAIVVDPFNTGRNGYRFETNVNGVRHEFLYQNNQLQPEWTVIWEARGAYTADGWSTEMAIPFKSLPFDPRVESWGFNVSRRVARRSEESVWVSRNRTWNPAIVGTISGLRGMNQGVGLDVVPGVVVAQRKDHLANVSNDSIDPSLDVYYRITPSLTGSLTINTDFSAAEVDDRQVNLTRFSLFFPEKRDFFLKDADLFEFGRIGAAGYSQGLRSVTRANQENGRPFFSRRIGLSALGTPVNLQYGGKLSGRIGRWTVGALAVRQDDFEAPPGSAGVEASNAFVGRVTANVFSESSIGLIATSGDPGAAGSNSVVGADFNYSNTRLAGNRTLEGELWGMKSSTPGLSGNDAAVGFGLRVPNATGFKGGVAGKQLGRNFRPALGFVNRVGVREVSGDFGFERFIRRRDMFAQSYYTGVDLYRASLIDGGLQTEIATFKPLEIDSRSNDRARTYVARTTEVLAQPFTIYRDPYRSLSVPVGRYTFTEYGIDLETGAQRGLSGKLNLRRGDFYDGTRRNIGGEVTWRPNSHVWLKAGYDMNDIDLPRGSVITRLMRASADIAFTTDLTWTTLFQYDNVSEVLGMHSRVQWVPKAGQELLFVINRNLQDYDRNNSFDPLVTELNGRVSYTFRF